VSPGVVTWPVPVREFALHKATVAGDAARLPATGPRIVLGTSGALSVADGRSALPLTPGGALFVPAGEPGVEVSGTGTAFQIDVAG
jgi:mannose-6-phosphate isomerase